MSLSPKQASATLDVLATQHDMEAAVKAFQAECFRGSPERINAATEAAHAAMQAHLDAQAANIAVARRSAGI